MLHIIPIVAVLAAACGAGSGPTTTDLGGSIPATSPGRGTLPNIPTHLERIAATWDTDFTKTTVDLEELMVGIPASDPRDLIRPIDDPAFAPAAETEWLDDVEPGVLFGVDGDVRFYPLSVLTRHEIVNDTFGDMAVAVTYCPLCNTAVVFDRRVDGATLRLGVSGLLRNSDLVMWDDQTESLWQQITGEGIVGSHAGDQLTVLPTRIVSFADFTAAHPGGRAMTEDQGFGIRYGINPYELYSSRDRPYGFFTGEIDDRFPALERMVGVTVGSTEKAYPFPALSRIGVVNDEIEGQPVLILWGSPDTADALDSGEIARGRGIGTAVAYNPEVDGETLTFAANGDVFVDDQTRSTWSILGLAIAGELAGTQLNIVQHRNEFWFAWQAFFPDGEVWEPRKR